MDISYNFGFLLYQTTTAWRSLLDKRLKSLGLSQAKWRALLHLAKANKALTQCELATSMDIDPSTVVGLIDRLSREGWVRRQEGEDRRAKHIHLTSKAKDMLVKIQQIVEQVQNEIFASINENSLNTCKSVLGQIKQSIEDINVKRD